MVNQQSASRLCGICEAPNRPCICPSCCRKLIASDRNTYATLVARRDALAISLHDALHAKVWMAVGTGRWHRLPNRRLCTSSSISSSKHSTARHRHALPLMHWMPSCNKVRIRGDVYVVS